MKDQMDRTVSKITALVLEIELIEKDADAWWEKERQRKLRLNKEITV